MNIPDMNPFVSVVSPVYRAEKIVPELAKRLDEELAKLTDRYEIVLVEDRSPDESWKAIEQAAKVYPKLQGIRLSRNFGQHKAITAGLHHSNGDYVVVIDCDLQEDPSDIQRLLTEAQKGYDIVYTRRDVRAHSGWKNIGANLFNRVFNWLSENDTMYSSSKIGTFSILSRKVVDAFCKISDYHRHYLLVLRWLGFHSTIITIDHHERFEGESSYNLQRLITHAIDGIASQSTRLLRLAIGVGLAFCLISLLSIALFTVLYFVQGFKEGWTSIIALILLCTGVILFFLGIMGIYIGNTFEQSKNKPLYLVDEIVGSGS